MPRSTSATLSTGLAVSRETRRAATPQFRHPFSFAVTSHRRKHDAPQIRGEVAYTYRATVRGSCSVAVAIP